jgi:hypothetical protein
MSRLISEIEADIYSKLVNYPVLYDNLTSQSNTAVYRNLVSLIAQVIFEHEVSQDLFLINLQTAVKSQVVGTLGWYILKSKEYQYGISPVDLGSGVIGYTSANPTLQIVKYISASEEAGAVYLKVAKDNGSGMPTALETYELANFRAFWDKVDFKPTFLKTDGSDVLDNITSGSGDILEITYTATLDKSIFIVDTDVPTDKGKRISDGVKAVEVAISDFLNTADKTTFGDVFYLHRLIDTVLSVQGVLNIVFSVARAKPYGGSYTDILTSSGVKYTKVSGYFGTITQTATYE